MKKLLASIGLALALATGPAVLISTSGCQSQQRIVFNTLYTIGHSVDSAYKGFNDAIIAGKVSASDMVKVAKLYTKYQTEFNLAVDAAQGNLNILAPTAVTQAASDLTTAISTAK